MDGVEQVTILGDAGVRQLTGYDRGTKLMKQLEFMFFKNQWVHSFISPQMDVATADFPFNVKGFIFLIRVNISPEITLGANL